MPDLSEYVQLLEELDLAMEQMRRSVERFRASVQATQDGEVPDFEMQGFLQSEQHRRGRETRASRERQRSAAGFGPLIEEQSERLGIRPQDVRG